MLGGGYNVLKMSTKKRHHYIPQFELKKYINLDGLIQVYDKFQKSFIEIPPVNFAAISHYYTLEIDGVRTTEIEDVLSDVEGIAEPLIEKICEKQVLTPEEQWELACYFALKGSRTPYAQERYEAIGESLVKEEFVKLASDQEEYNDVVEKIMPGFSDEKKEEYREFMLDTERYQVKFERLLSVQGIFANLKEFYEAIYFMSWHVVYSPPDRAFISSDNPFFTFPLRLEDKRKDLGLYSHNTITAVLVSPKVVILLRHTKPGRHVSTLDNATVKYINKQIAKYSHRYIFSHNLHLLRRIIKRDLT